jgi:ABC-2 type transport system permease protein
MSKAFLELFKINSKLFYRNPAALFWTVAMPVVFYIGLGFVPINRLIGTDYSYATFLLPGMIAYVIMQGGIYGLAYWMVDMRSRGVIKRFVVTPVKPYQMAISVVASRLVVMLMQVVVLTLVGVFLFDVHFTWNILSILAFTLLGGTVFLVLGLLISSFASTYETAAPITAAIGLPLTALGNIFFPIEKLPEVVQWIAKVLPISYLADGLRKVYLGPFNWETVYVDFLVLLLWAAVMLALVIWRFKLEE